MMETDPRLEDSLGVPVSSRERDFIKNVSIWRQSRALVNKVVCVCMYVTMSVINKKKYSFLRE